MARLWSERSLTSFRQLLRPRWRAVTALATTSMLAGLSEAGFLVLLARISVTIVGGDASVPLTGGVSATVGQAILIGLALVVTRLALSVVNAWQVARLASSITAAIRRELATAYMRADWSAQHGVRLGALQELLTTFAQQGTMLATSFAGGVTAAFNLVALLVAAVLVDARSSLTVVGAMVVLGLVFAPLRAAIRGQAKATADTGMEFATSLTEVSQLGLEMHVFGVGPQLERRVQALIQAHRATQRRLRYLLALGPSLYVGLAYLAIILALAGIATLGRGQVSAAGAVLLILLRALSYGQAIQSSTTSIHSNLPFLATVDQRVAHFRAHRRRFGSVRLDPVSRIDLDGVHFGYEADEPVLHDITATIRARDVVGIVGPSGSGKSTLVQLLLGVREPTLGRITVNEVPLPQVSRDHWNRVVAFVPQQPRLVAGTIADNIRFMRDDVTDIAIARAASAAGMDPDLAGWPEGLSRQVGEAGSQLSGGQQQRLVIARALVEDPELIVLDEPTSALDAGAEATIRATIDRLRANTTIVVVAHRWSTLQVCDRIMVIQNGELVADDTPRALEASSQFYRDILAHSDLRP